MPANNDKPGIRPSLLFKSVGELGSAFCSAAGQNLAAVSGCHSFAESVLFLALTLLGLIGTKHSDAPAFLNFNTQQ
jgi:hypothetical protein